MSLQKYSDTEADFWKEHFVHLQHKNMVRANALPLHMADCKAEFEAFTASHPDAKISCEYFPFYCTFEVTLTTTIKLRLFIQNTIKASLMQKCGSEYIKICDAKFPYNPLPEISEFLAGLPNYLAELSQSLEKKSRSNRRQKLAQEFIKAYASAHLKQAFTINPNEDGTFNLALPVNIINIQITEDDFMQKIAEIK
ncbi:MAG: hypothetical protein MSH65_09040 [Spirochaetia bacterium]|nr:hypothetical protein [Spirochaetia bacterium]MDY5818485.1 hypothetical protein [Treponema sp.]